MTDRQTDRHTHIHTYIQTDRHIFNACDGRSCIHIDLPQPPPAAHFAVPPPGPGARPTKECRERGLTHECTQTYLQGRTERELTHMSAHILTSACCSFGTAAAWAGSTSCKGESRERGDLNKAYTYIQGRLHGRMQ